jgi:hypothetical protein
MILTYDAFKEALEEQEKRETHLKSMDSRINSQNIVLQVQQGLLEIIANAMRVHQDGLSDENIVRAFKEIPNTILNLTQTDLKRYQLKR